MAVAKKMTGLGKGLDALLGDYDVGVTPNSSGVREVAIGELRTNPDQPRKHFNEDRLKELAGSLALHGMVQPIVVKREQKGYMIITGERRYRAAKLAGLKFVPIVEKEYEDEQIHEIALIENIQREDLNPVEEAAAISFLMRQHDLTQEEVAERLFKSRPAVANTLRLLALPEPIKIMLREGTLSAGHGRALSALNDEQLQVKLAKQAQESRCSVRALEQIVKAAAAQASGHAEEEPHAPRKQAEQRALDPDLYDVESRLRERLGTKVKIVGGKRRGKIMIEYFSPDALQEIYDIILG